MTRLSFGVSDEVNQEEILSVSSEFDKETQEHEKFNLIEETRLLLNIALPSVCVQFCTLFIFPLTASAVGLRFGTEELAGFSLGSLVGNLTCLSVMVGALTAADTLMPRSYSGGNYREVGRLAIRGFVVCSLLLIPPLVPLLVCVEDIFDALGQDPVASKLASRWIRIYLLGIPAVLLFRCLRSFLTAQHQVFPLAVGASVACFVAHPIFLKIFLPLFDFSGSAVALDLTQYVTASITLVYLLARPVHRAETWPGLSLEYFFEAIQPKPMLDFLSLSVGGVLSLSEWWFWETVCFIVGSFGVVPLCVHTIAYNLVPLLFMIPLGFSIGLTVRIGNVISSDVRRAKLLAAWCMAFIILLGATVALLLFQFRVAIAKLFSTDPEVIEGCQQIWPKLCYYIFMLHIFGINSAILRALGMQWRMAAIVFLCLWLFTLPTIVVVAIRNGGGLDAVWSILPCFYTFMQLLLALTYLTADWNKISKEIREETEHKLSEGRTNMKKDGILPDETTELLA